MLKCFVHRSVSEGVFNRLIVNETKIIQTEGAEEFLSRINPDSEVRLSRTISREAYRDLSFNVWLAKPHACPVFSGSGLCECL